MKEEVKMKTLWNQIKFQKDLYLTGVLVMLGMYVFGNVLHDVLAVSDDEVTSVICMGSMMATIALYMMMFFFAGIHMVQIFNYAVAMGQTRKRTFPMYTLATLLTFLVLGAFLKVLNILEKLRLKLMFPGIKIENFMALVLSWKYILAFALVGTAFAMLLGASISRFGKAAFWVWWALLMIICIGGPRGFTYLTDFYPDSQATSFVVHVIEMTVQHAHAISAVLVIAATIIFSGVAYLIVRRQQVNV